MFLQIVDRMVQQIIVKPAFVFRIRRDIHAKEVAVIIQQLTGQMKCVGFESVCLIPRILGITVIYDDDITTRMQKRNKVTVDFVFVGNAFAFLNRGKPAPDTGKTNDRKSFFHRLGCLLLALGQIQWRIRIVIQIAEHAFREEAPDTSMRRRSVFHFYATRLR
ncbi:hypothetical protein SDC9_150547 [bioreactor metagenome]|uniref:Uncharacterized protein n=1 Tax=bioreactor metagenome TaxID=1076179 RepID=A0A645EPP0_9ZZZZ